MRLEGGWAGRSPAWHPVGEREAESTRCRARQKLVSGQWQSRANLLSDSNFLLSKDYVPYVPKLGTSIFFCSPLKTRMFPIFFIILFISVPMFQCSKKNTTDS